MITVHLNHVVSSVRVDEKDQVEQYDLFMHNSGVLKYRVYLRGLR